MTLAICNFLLSYPRLTLVSPLENRDHRILRFSFWLKLTFIVIEVALVIAFGVLLTRSDNDAAGVLEWVIAFVFSFYVFSFALDLYPAVRTKNPEKRFSRDPMLMNGGVDESRVPSRGARQQHMAEHHLWQPRQSNF